MHSQSLVIRPGGYALPPVAVRLQRLQPYINERMMHLHHDEHHRGYGEDLNEAELVLVEA